MTSHFGGRFLETTTTTGNGNLTLDGAVANHVTFDSKCTVNGDIHPYTLAGNLQWEWGFLTRVSAGVYSRTVLFNSSGTAAALSLSAGTKEVWGEIPADLLRWMAHASLLRNGFPQLTIVPQGRLTLVSIVPVMTSSQASKTTIYYTAYTGRLIPLFDGTRFAPVDFGQEISQATTDTTKSPAAVTTNSNYDLFVWDDAGTIRLSRGPAWSSGTSRGTGAGTTELTDIAMGSLHGGILLNANAITNGPAAGRGTYVGTVRSDGSSQINFVLGGSASGGTAAILGVWNAYNRVNVRPAVTDSGASYTYTSNTIRQARASAGNQISFVMGLAEDAILASYSGMVATTTTAGSFGAYSVGLDTTSAFTFQRVIVYTPAAATLIGGSPNTQTIDPQIGFHFLSANEQSDGTNASTFDFNSVNILSGIFRM